ncbi:MAG: ATP-binding protein, partial [Acidimicrobiales bacterium]
SPADLDTIASVSRRLDGIPLAIELAACRTTAMTITDLAEHLGDRFRLLRGGRRGVERHQTLGAVVGWSYELLDRSEQALFNQLSVFAGGFDLTAIEAVCAKEDSPIDLIGRLVDKSLVVADRQRRHVRYRVLETLRQYGEERLDPGQLTSLHDRHLAYYQQIGQQADTLARGSGWSEALHLFREEWNNLRAAHSWAVACGDLDAATDLIGSTTTFALVTHRIEHDEWTSNTIALARDLNQPVPTVVAGAGSYWLHHHFRHTEAHALARIGIDNAPTPTHRSTMYCWQARCRPGANDDLKAAFRSYERAVSAPRDEIFKALVGFLYTTFVSTETTEYGVALAQQASNAVDSPLARCWHLAASGRAAYEQRDYDSAMALTREAGELSRSTGHPGMETICNGNIALILATRGGPIDRAIYEPALIANHRHRTHVETVLGRLAIHLTACDQLEAAGVLAGYVQSTGAIVRGGQLLPDLPETPLVDKSKAKGADLDLDQAVAYALAVLARFD